MDSVPPDNFEAELEREVELVLHQGEERRRQTAVARIHSGGGTAVVGRVLVLAVAIAIGLAAIQVAALLTGLDLLGDLCRAAGVCG